jgi:GNAT superfamily N-acetyltransferase
MLTAATDDETVAAITGLINDVYASAEEGLWADGAARTTKEEVAALVREGRLAAACLDGHLVGCVRTGRLDDRTSDFGLLAADPRHRGAGVGRDLVRYAERRGLDAGSTTMRLELLVPREWSHPFKEFLAGWYGRLGYRRIGTGTVEAAHPGLAPLLATPCDLAVYEKDLRLRP